MYTMSHIKAFCHFQMLSLADAFVCSKETIITIRVNLFLCQPCDGKCDLLCALRSLLFVRTKFCCLSTPQISRVLIIAE